MGLAVLEMFFIFFYACSNSKPVMMKPEENVTTGTLENNNKPGETDSERFASEYPLVGSDNVFVFRDASETADILANGTGVVFMGFKECPWCQYYAVYLNETAQKMDIRKIFYCDIKEDRQNNTKSYQRIVSILSSLLQYDDEGRRKVFVPDVTIIENGRIIGHDFETSKDTMGYQTPQDYWTTERVVALKERLRESLSQISKICNLCNY